MDDEIDKDKIGFIAQEISSILPETITLSGLSGDPYDAGMITMGSVDLTNFGLSNGQVTINGNPSGAYLTSNSGSSIWTTTNISNQPAISINNPSGKNTIKTPKHEIDIDELAETIDVLKKRLLVLTPEFEKHEKYPMLKEMYNEYKAMERLLSGPDKEDNNE
jgi:hypothetical protein